MFELGGEGDGEVEGADAQGRGFEVEKVLLGEARDELGAEAVGAAAFVEDDEAVGAGEGSFDGVEAQGGEGAEVEEVEGGLVFSFKIRGDLGGEVGHLAVGDEGGEVAGGEVTGGPHVAVGGVPGDRAFAAAVETLVLEEEDGGCRLRRRRAWR